MRQVNPEFTSRCVKPQTGTEFGFEFVRYPLVHIVPNIDLRVEYCQ